MIDLIKLRFDRNFGGHVAGTTAMIPRTHAEKLLALAVAHVDAPETPKAANRSREVSSRTIRKA